MKRLAAFIFILMVAGISAFAQESFVYESDHYRVRSHHSRQHAEQTTARLEAYLDLFNEYFHFDLEELDHKFNVQVFDTQEKCDQYLSRLIKETRGEFVYLHYSDISRSKLVGTQESEEEYDPSFTHQAFVQFLRAYIQNPPLWIREGFAVYFEEAGYDENFGAVINSENVAWLETLKDILFGEHSAEALSTNEVLASNIEKAKNNINVFYPEAWGIVNYLLNTENRVHNRILWDSISSMDPDTDLVSNSAAVYDSAFQWVNQDELQNSFMEYFRAKKTYKEFIEDGIAAYEIGELDASEEKFLVAINRQDISYIPYYYLGLINYDRGNFTLAELNYNKALEKGSTAALTYYALGVNAFADNRFDAATEFLKTTIHLDPRNYAQKVIQILDRMEG